MDVNRTKSNHSFEKHMKESTHNFNYTDTKILQKERNRKNLRIHGSYILFKTKTL